MEVLQVPPICDLRCPARSELEAANLGAAHEGFGPEGDNRERRRRAETRDLRGQVERGRESAKPGWERHRSVCGEADALTSRASTPSLPPGTIEGDV